MLSNKLCGTRLVLSLVVRGSWWSSFDRFWHFKFRKRRCLLGLIILENSTWLRLGTAGFVEDSLVERMNDKITELQTVIQANKRQSTQVVLRFKEWHRRNAQSWTNKNGITIFHISANSSAMQIVFLLILLHFVQILWSCLLCAFYFSFPILLFEICPVPPLSRFSHAFLRRQRHRRCLSLLRESLAPGTSRWAPRRLLHRRRRDPCNGSNEIGRKEKDYNWLYVYIIMYMIRNSRNYYYS